MNPIIQLKQTTSVFLVALLLVSIAIPWSAQAVSPAPDGGYPGGNTAEGDFALQNLTTGTFNTALGAFTLFSNSTGLQNTATGAGALFRNTEGFNNTANGAGALENNTLGKANTGIGFAALFANTTISGNTGNQNTAIGNTALLNNTIGTSNTAVGSQALLNNVQGNRNTAVGKDALFTNTSVDNTAVGFQALFSNDIGSNNTAIGSQALFSNSGSNNTATGSGALSTNTIGFDNTATGINALFRNTKGTSNTAIGLGSLAFNTIGADNIALGASAGSIIGTGSFNIDIGNGGGAASESNTIRIGAVQTATFIAGINGVNQGSPTAVFINTTTGQLGTTPPSSSRRFKKEIKPMDRTSEAILAFKPVTFRYKSDDKGTPQFGLIAEEVAAVNPDLIVRDDKGEIYTVRYDAVNAMLLNEFLNEHKAFLAERRKVQKQEAAIAELKSGMKALIAITKEQAAQIQKLSAQLEVNKPAPQVVDNNR